jgi:8-amino-7-oxononanoate synthase
MHDPLAWIDDELALLRQQGLERKLTERSGAQGPIVECAGRRLVNFGSNDYLSLAADRRLIDAAHSASQQQGWGAGASPLISGHGASQARLEARLAEFLGTPAALVFPSGFAANIGAISALVGRGDVVLSDSKNHASLIDGCRLSRAELLVYPHGEASAVDELLRGARGFRRRLVVSDSLFSMDGDFAPLADLAALAERYDAMLLVDEAHATGLFGPRGSGLVEMLGIEERVHVRVGTLSKALGSAGGFVAGSRALVDWLVNRARPYVFSTAHPAAMSAAASAAIDIVEREPWRRTELLERAGQLRARLGSAGWNIGRTVSQIIPLVVGEPERAMRLAALVAEEGFWVPGIRPPSVPPGESLLRLSLCYAHTPDQFQALLQALARAAQAI